MDLEPFFDFFSSYQVTETTQKITKKFSKCFKDLEEWKRTGKEVVIKIKVDKSERPVSVFLDIVSKLSTELKEEFNFKETDLWKLYDRRF